MSRKLAVGCFLWCVLAWPALGLAEPVVKVTLKDGSQVFGEIIQMTGGLLTLKTIFHEGDPVKIKWSEVAGIDSEEGLTFVLTNGTILYGTPVLTQPGTLGVQTEMLPEPLAVEVDLVAAVNPPPKKAVTYTGNVNFGGSKTTGNTKIQNISLVGEFIARSERLRLSMLGRYLYGENNGELVARNAFGTIKLDFFVTQRFFMNVGALFEQDTFQDLNLRTMLFSGPGYQFIEKGDFSSTYFEKMQLSGELGVGFYNEDFKIAEDQSSVSGRWAVNFDWPVTPTVTIFHQHQGFTAVEEPSDFYINSQQGIRLKVWGNLISSFQVNWRYDNTPSPGFKNTDIQYLLTIGYAFES